MLIFSSKLLYSGWALFSGFLSGVFLIGYIWVVSFSESLNISFSISSSHNWEFSFSAFLDPFALIFSSVVCLITFVVILFAAFYMTGDLNNFYFSIITVLFVCSMLLVINISDLVILMLGWDGLGVVSFFLIVHYQSPSSIFSGIFTLLMNRIGDSLIIACIVLMGKSLPSVFSFNFWDPSFQLFCLVLLSGLITKSAIFPFSPWLPAAIAAPTPISSLVHSSTLVTAGLYLIMRFSSYLYMITSICNLIIILGVFTSFYAGLNSVFEVDLNNLVALSTLSHLGFICVSLFSGYLSLSFLHLLAHASFKSLLFVSVGGLMVNMSHYQDSRYFSSGIIFSSYFTFVGVVSSCSLLGFPFLSGFYSNDYIIESMFYSVSSYLVMVVLFLNVVFTYIYTMRIVLGLTSSSNTSPLFLFSSPSTGFMGALIILSVASLSISSFFLNTSDHLCAPFFTPSLVNFYLLLMSALVFIYYSYHFYLFYFANSHFVEFSSSMIYLSFFCSNFSSNTYYNSALLLFNSFEAGAMGSIINSSLLQWFQSSIILSHSMFYYSFTFISLLLISLIAIF